MSLAVVVDRWDAPELDHAWAVPSFVEQRQLLAQRFPWGGAAFDDIFWLLFKARPELSSRESVERSHVVGHVLVSLLARNPAVRRLRCSTMRDATGAALVAAKLAPEIVMTAAGLSSGALERAEQEADPSEEDTQATATAAAESALESLESACEAIAEDEEDRARTAEVWGLGDGELRRLPLAEREALARKLDNPRAKAITDLFGRLRDSMFAERAEIDGVGVEPVDVEMGGDLSRMVGAELLSMLQDELFYARLGDGALRQYAMRGVDQMARGGIVLCVDCSESMTWPHQDYTRELWASAFKLHLLQTAIREGRPLHLINFSSSVSYHRFVDPEERTPLRVLKATSEWYGFGTRFAAPLLQAIKVLAEEDDRNCDVVFVSDGECTLSGRTRQTYQRAMRMRGVRTWGVQLGRRPGGLADFCDQIFQITDLTSGRELGTLLNAVESTPARC